MKTVQISNVKRIKTDTVDLIVLALANGKPDIVRSPSEFLNDLRGSFIVDEGVNSMNHPQVRKCLRNLRGGTLEGELKYAKAGDTWVVTENSQVITNPKAKGFGEYAVGDDKPYEKDATIVTDGFLTLDLKEDAYQREENAEAYASKRVNTADAFDVAPDFSGGTTESGEGDVNGGEGDEGNGEEDHATPINKVNKATAGEAGVE